MGIYFNSWHIWENVWGRVFTPLWCLKASSPATKKWIFEFCTNLDSETIFKPFGLYGWLKVSYLLDYMKSKYSTILSENHGSLARLVNQLNKEPYTKLVKIKSCDSFDLEPAQTWNSNCPCLLRYKLCKYSTFV